MQVAENSTPSERRPTGIAGLDRILEGGLLIAGVYIVQGPPGAGKTILANQACFHHASTGGRAVYVTLLAESHSRMFAHLRRMAFFDESAIPDRVYYIGGYSALESNGLDALVTLIRQAIQKHNATLAGRRRPGLRARIVADRSGVQEVPARDSDAGRAHHLYGAAPDQRRTRQWVLSRSTPWSTACCT